METKLDSVEAGTKTGSWFKPKKGSVFPRKKSTCSTAINVQGAALLAVLVSSRAALLNSNGSVWRLRQYRNGYLVVLYVFTRCNQNGYKYVSPRLSQISKLDFRACFILEYKGMVII
ncbi:hypothetical protein D5086_026680 [Populus alba]|uniref:Uncharacterized protein n=1 Tax=Populus alba TaxID=43335 RepID=A0ACC4B328_POPAL